MRVLFISRAYPPVVGGIEKENREIFNSLSKYLEVCLVANRRGKSFLPFFFVYAFIKSAWMLRHYDVVLLGDGVACVLGRALQMISRKPMIGIVHGLDLTYNNRLYQLLWIKQFIGRMDKLIAIGNETIIQGVLRGIPRSKFAFVPDGVHVERKVNRYTKNDLERLTNRKIKGKILLTLGRLVERKGIVWFVENVMVNLRDDIVYVVAGTGNEKNRLLAAIEKLEFKDRVIYVGGVSEQEKEMLYLTADIFVQPNITVEGDMEGFGLVVLEAASYGLPVVASNIEGLKDAIHNGKNGFLLEERDADAYKQKIESLFMDDESRRQFGANARKYVEEHFSWERTARQYVNIFKECVN